MNKNKPEDRRNQVALIDGSKGWKLLKKSKGDKRREMCPEHRQAIVDALTNFVPSDICKIYNREYFYYNKQFLTLTDVDDNGRSVLDTICPMGKSFALSEAHSIKLGDEPYRDLDDIPMSDAYTIGKRISEQKQQLYVAVRIADDEEYAFDIERQTIVHRLHGKETDLGMGVFVFKVSKTKKGTSWKISIEPSTQSDYEIIPHHFDAETNAEEIQRFMDKYIFKPYVLGKNIVGVELNFNKEFYVPEKLESVDDILAELKQLDSDLQAITI